MECAYLGSNAISMVVWFVLFLMRKDLRSMMIIMSVCAMPIALFDLVFVPSYWQPVTIGDIPVGIEGFLFSFSVGGIAAALYPTITGRKIRRLPKRQLQQLLKRALVPVLTLAAFVVSYALGIPNPELAAYVAIVVGVSALLYMRPDLRQTVLYSAVAFAAVYYVALKIWTLLFPATHSWFTFEHLPYLFFWGVPGWEAIFGLFFGALWSGLYGLLFGYDMVKK